MAKKTSEKKTDVKKKSPPARKKAPFVFDKKVMPVPAPRGHKRSDGEIILYSWNINGIRAISKKGLIEWIANRKMDALFLQETKATMEQIQDDDNASEILKFDEYDFRTVSAEQKGYSGVASLSRKTLNPVFQEGLRVDHALKFNSEGRVIVTTIGDFEIWNAYYPNGGRGADRIEYKLKFYEHCFLQWEEARKTKKVILCGDFNTAHHEIDLARPDANKTNTGFLPEERAFLDKITSSGYVDVFRKFEQGPNWYTYWDQVTMARNRNVGWRIDYFYVTEETMPFVTDAWIEMEVSGSDHCPIGLSLKLGG